LTDFAIAQRGAARRNGVAGGSISAHQSTDFVENAPILRFVQLPG
jgi:hypothetical protein